MTLASLHTASAIRRSWARSVGVCKTGTIGSLPGEGLGACGLCGAEVHPERMNTEEDHRSMVVTSSEIAYASKPGYSELMERWVRERQREEVG